VDFSWDCSLLVSGSADKTIKIWGLDFGDCHRSLQAHSDSVSCLRFQPHTHYFLSTGRDGVLKYWDADRWGLGIECFVSAARWGSVLSMDRPLSLISNMLVSGHIECVGRTDPGASFRPSDNISAEDMLIVFLPV